MRANTLPHTGIGDSSRQATSVAKVSYWYLPGGYDAVNARIIECYFDDLETATKFAAKYDAPPEMAMVLPIDTVPAST